MAEHSKFGPVAAEHDLTPQTDSKVAETEEIRADKVQTVTHDSGGLDNGKSISTVKLDVTDWKPAHRNSC